MASIQQSIGGLTGSLLGAALGFSHFYSQTPEAQNKLEGKRLIKQGQAKQKTWEKVYGYDLAKADLYEEGRRDIVKGASLYPSKKNLKLAEPEIKGLKVSEGVDEALRQDIEDYEKNMAATREYDEALKTIRATILSQDITDMNSNATLRYQEALEKARKLRGEQNGN